MKFAKATRQALAAMSYLAEIHFRGSRSASSAEVGRARGMAATIAAKLLSETASAGLTVGTTGPGGGYRLARAPQEISLRDIVSLFEREQEELPCPYGPGYCGSGTPCPLHDQLERISCEAKSFLHNTTLAVFASN